MPSKHARIATTPLNTADYSYEYIDAIQAINYLQHGRNTYYAVLR